MVDKVGKTFKKYLSQFGGLVMHDNYLNVQSDE